MTYCRETRDKKNAVRVRVKPTSKRPRFKSITQVVIDTRGKKDANLSSQYAKNPCETIKQIRDKMSVGVLWGL
jgi:hypothetical protein